MKRKATGLTRLPNIRFYILLVVASTIVLYTILAGIILGEQFYGKMHSNKHLFTVFAQQLQQEAVAFPAANFFSKKERINISVTKQPEWQLQFSEKVSIKKIQARINLGNELSFSYKLPNRQQLWLNYAQIPSEASYYKLAAFFIGFLIILIFLVFYSWVVTVYNIVIQKIQHSTQQLGGDINAHLSKVGGLPVLQDTSDMLLKMQRKIKDLVNYRTRMLGTISHDLRTPITRLKFKTEMIENIKLRDRINQDLDQMNIMIDELLVFAKQDVFKEQKIKLNLSSLLETICFEFADLNYPVTLEKITVKARFYGAKLALRRCFTNIIQNGMKYGERVSVALCLVDDKIRITFKDAGPGIPKHDLKNVFKPFYRSEEGKRTSSTGTGLGLSIVQEVVQHHEGEVFLTNANEGGLIVTIEFPVNVKTSAEASSKL